MFDLVEQEIHDLHRFFTDWISGKCPNNSQVFARLEGALSESFVLISPQAQPVDRSTVLQQVRSAHGVRPELLISTQNVRLLQTVGTVLIASYEEHQEDGTSKTSRLSTVVFEHQADRARELQWLHVHETWMG